MATDLGYQSRFDHGALGHFKDGALVLEGEAHLKDGTSVMQRITWKAHDKGVRESAVLSKDGGKTWTPAFDVLFLKRSTPQARLTEDIPNACAAPRRAREQAGVIRQG